MAGPATSCRRYSEACRRSVPYTFLAAKLRRETKGHFPGGENGDYRERWEPDFPTGLSFSTARRERPDDLSHVKKTLSPGVPVHPPHSIFRCLRAVACLQRGRLACRGSTNNYATAPTSRRLLATISRTAGFVNHKRRKRLIQSSSCKQVSFSGVDATARALQHACRTARRFSWAARQSSAG